MGIFYHKKRMKEIVKTKPKCLAEVNEINNLTEKNKGQASKIKIYRGRKTRTKTQGPEIEANTDFKGWCSEI